MNCSHYTVIRGIQKSYISLIKSLNFDIIASDISKMDNELNVYRNEILNFWCDNAEALMNAIKKVELVSLGVWGEMGIVDLTPKCLLYFDTVFIPDPIPSFTSEWHSLTTEKKKELLESYTEIVKMLSDFANADFSFPLVVFFPQYYKELVNNEEIDRLAKDRAMELTFLSLDKCLNINTRIKSIEEFFIICDAYGMNIVNEKLDEHKMHRFMNYVFKNGGFLHQSHTKGLTEPFIEGLEKRVLSKRIKHKDLPEIGGIIYSGYYLSFMRNFDAKAYGFHPSTSMEYWNFNTVTNEIFQSLLIDTECISQDDVVVNSFQTNFKWIENITLDDCLRLRNEEKLEDLRNIFKKETILLSSAGIKDFKAIGHAYEKNISIILQEHYDASQKIIKKYKKNIAMSSLSFGANAMLGVASLASQTASIISLIFSLSWGGKSILNIMEDTRDLNIHQISNNRNPLTFLYSQYCKVSEK